MNLCAFTGRFTATPELKVTPNGKSVCSFTLAVERRFKGSDGKPIVDYPDFVAWEHNAEFICKWFDKGVKVAVTSELQTRTYTDKEGKNRKVTELVVNTVEFADGKKDANTGVDNSKVTNIAPAVADNEPAFPDIDGFMPIEEDELPFN